MLHTAQPYLIKKYHQKLGLFLNPKFLYPCKFYYITSLMKNQQSPLFWALILYKAPAQSSDPALFKYTGCTKKGVIFLSNGIVWRSVHLKIGDWGRDSWWQDGKFFWKAFLFVVNWNCYWEQQQPYIQQKTIVRERRKIRRDAVLPTLEIFYALMQCWKKLHTYICMQNILVHLAFRLFFWQNLFFFVPFFWKLGRNFVFQLRLFFSQNIIPISIFIRVGNTD